MANQELKSLVLVVSFLGLFAVWVTMIPSGFYASEYEGRELTVPDYFEGIDIQTFSQTSNFTIDFSGSQVFDEYFDLGGWHMYFQGYKYGLDYLKAAHYASWWIFGWDYHYADWCLTTSGANYGTELTFTDLDNIWDGQTNMIAFNCRTDQTQWRVYFGWNTTTYAKPSDAIAANEMEVLYGIGFDKVNTSINAWNIVGSLLFFQMPDVHPLINLVIAIPIWAAIGYLVYVLILKAIPFVGG